MLILQQHTVSEHRQCQWAEMEVQWWRYAATQMDITMLLLYSCTCSMCWTHTHITSSCCVRLPVTQQMFLTTYQLIRLLIFCRHRAKKRQIVEMTNDWLIGLRFYVPLETKRSFWRSSSQWISWLGIEETKSNTTKASNTWIKWSKLTQKNMKC